jgi:predicted transcriptional regulator
MTRKENRVPTAESPLSVRLDRDVKGELARLAAKHERTVSGEVRLAIREYTARYPKLETSLALGAGRPSPSGGDEAA